MKYLLSAFLILCSIASGFFSAQYFDQKTSSAKLGQVNFVGLLPTTLSGAGITSSATSISVTSLTIQQTGQKLSMSDFGSIGYVTLEPGSPSKQEFASFTGITQNSNGTAVLTGVTRGLSPVYPYTASTSVRFSHGGGTKVIVSNSPPFYNNFLLTSNTATVTAAYIYASTSLPGVALDTTDAQVSAATTTFATVNLLNGLTISGAPNGSTIVKGIFEQAIATEASSSAATGATAANLVIGSNLVSATPGASLIAMTQSTGKLLQGWFDLTQLFNFSGGIITASSTQMGTSTAQKGVKTLGTNIFMEFQAGTTTAGQSTPQPVYISTTTGQVLFSEADDNIASQFVGFSVSGAALGATTTVQLDGIVQGFTGLTRGAKYYVTNNPGTISSTMGTNEVFVGRAISQTELLIERSPDLAGQYLGQPTVRTNVYSGATSHAASSTIPSTAREIIVQTSITGTGSSAGLCQLVIKRVGATTNQTCTTSGINGATVVAVYTAQVSLSGDLLTINASTAGSGINVTSTNHTVYLYR